MKYKSIVHAVGLAFGAVLLSGAPVGAQAYEGTLAKIQETGQITLGVRDTSAPFNYQDDNQQHVGFSLDMCMLIVDQVRKVLKDTDVEVEMTLTTAASRIPLLANGTTDLQCDGASNTVERQKQVSFSPTIFITGNALLTKKASNVKTIDDLKGKPVVAMSGTTNIKQIAELNKEKNLGMNILTATEHNEAFLMVETGRAVAYAQDDIYEALLIANSKSPDDYTISDTMSVDPYGLMFRRNDPEFKAVVDEAIIDSFKSGKYKEIYNKWFESPIPPKNVNLNLPISKVLQAALDNPSDSPDPDYYFSLVK